MVIKEESKKVKLVEYTEKKVSCKDFDDCALMQFYKERTEYLEDLVKKYKFDYLTGLMGKIDYTEKVGYLFEEYKFADQMFFFVMVDIDNLHNMNRMHGYHYGDEIIKDVARQLRNHFEFHQIYRVSGDEFVLLIRSYYCSEEDLKNRLNTIENITYVIETPEDYTNPKHIFKTADMKLTEMKNARKRM